MIVPILWKRTGDVHDTGKYGMYVMRQMVEKILEVQGSMALGFPRFGENL